VRLRILPGHEDRWDRVLVSLDDITARVAAYRERTEAERYARGLFNHSPVSLWVEDFSAVKKLLDEIRQRGITDFATFIKVHPEFVTRCMQEIRVIDVNRETLRMFGAADTAQQREVVNYSLAGDPIHIHMQFTVLQHHLQTWRRRPPVFAAAIAGSWHASCKAVACSPS